MPNESTSKTMKKLKIYLDTSVISMLDNSPRGVITKKFFEFVTQNDCELVISEAVENEIDETEQTKKKEIIYFLNQLKITKISHDNESDNLAWNYINDGILTHNHFDDLSHVAYATVHKCDMIVSWNRKHIAKSIKIQKLNACNIKNNYSLIAVYTPEEFLTFYK
jgi:predicted nucleic acid-binding protein